MKFISFCPDILSEAPSGAMLALGCFDGLHSGHRALLAHAKEEADKRGIAVGVWSPAGAKPGPRLHDEGQKLQMLACLGVHFYIEEPFEELRLLSPEDFFDAYLLGRYHASALACGQTFTFGKDRSGNSEVLKKLCASAGIPLIVEQTVYADGRPVSSTAVRQALARGDIQAATRLLAGDVVFCAVTREGRHVGRDLGYPTLNLPFAGDCPYKNGVYTASVSVDGKKAVPALVNIGVHPTFEEAEKPLCEVHLLQNPGEDNMYGKKVSVTFHRFLRPEKKFENETELQKQLKKDEECARSMWEQILAKQ